MRCAKRPDSPSSQAVGNAVGLRKNEVVWRSVFAVTVLPVAYAVMKKGLVDAFQIGYRDLPSNPNVESIKIASDPIKVTRVTALNEKGLNPYLTVHHILSYTYSKLHSLVVRQTKTVRVWREQLNCKDYKATKHTVEITDGRHTVQNTYFRFLKALLRVFNTNAVQKSAVMRFCFHIKDPHQQLSKHARARIVLGDSVRKAGWHCVVSPWIKYLWNMKEFHYCGLRRQNWQFELARLLEDRLVLPCILKNVFDTGKVKKNTD